LPGVPATFSTGVVSGATLEAAADALPDAWFPPSLPPPQADSGSKAARRRRRMEQQSLTRARVPVADTPPGLPPVILAR
jgi:hypothetical protein